MATYSLSPNGLLDSGAELVGVTKSIEASLAELDGFVKRFIAVNLGGAATSYEAAQRAWSDGLGTMQLALADGATAIDNIRQNYHVADTQGASLFGGQV